MIDIQPVPFSIRVTGETTGTEYVGSFKVKPILHQADQLARDAAVRDILGSRASDANPRAVSAAFIIAEIQIRSIETPNFWKESKNGLTLYDEAPMTAAYDKIQEIEKQWREDVKKKADAARTVLEIPLKQG